MHWKNVLKNRTPENIIAQSVVLIASLVAYYVYQDALERRMEMEYIKQFGDQIRLNNQAFGFVDE